MTTKAQRIDQLEHELRQNEATRRSLEHDLERTAGLEESVEIAKAQRDEALRELAERSAEGRLQVARLVEQSDRARADATALREERNEARREAEHWQQTADETANEIERLRGVIEEIALGRGVVMETELDVHAEGERLAENLGITPLIPETREDYLRRRGWTLRMIDGTAWWDRAVPGTLQPSSTMQSVQGTRAAYAIQASEDGAIGPAPPQALWTGLELNLQFGRNAHPARYRIVEFAQESGGPVTLLVEPA